jgi:hypothetical protein
MRKENELSPLFVGSRVQKRRQHFVSFPNFTNNPTAPLKSKKPPFLPYKQSKEQFESSCFFVKVSNSSDVESVFLEAYSPYEKSIKQISFLHHKKSKIKL